jgi:hypothetical protein
MRGTRLPVARFYARNNARDTITCRPFLVARASTPTGTAGFPAGQAFDQQKAVVDELFRELSTYAVNYAEERRENL